MAEENLYGDAFKNVKFPDFSDFFRRTASAYRSTLNPYGSQGIREAARQNGMRSGGPSAAVSAAADRQMAEVARLGGASGLQSALNNEMLRQMSEQGGATPPPSGQMGSGAGRNPIQALFAPMFQDLKRQRQLANQRYEANSQQVTNIYGQITGARSADKAATEAAFQRLVDAASTRSQAVNTGIDASEAARLQQNQAALQGMGLGELSTSQGDIASQTAAQAQQTNLLNSANWENMLRAMGATAGQQVDADVAGFNYAMAEDLGRLRGAREEFAQELGQQRGQLRSQRAQAAFEYQQAQQRSAAAARAAEQKAAMQMATEADRQAADALRAAGPAHVTVDAFVRRGEMSPAEGAAALDAITEFYQFNTAPRGKWFSGEAKGVMFDAAGDTLSPAQKRAISAIFDQTLPKG
jgi:hypothetical protein